VLTDAGAVLLAEAQALLQDVDSLETMASTLSRGLEPRVRMSVESLFPKSLLFAALDSFRRSSASTYVELREVMRLDAETALTLDQCDLCIGHMIPSGYLGDHLIDLELVAVAAADHPLQRIDRLLTLDDLSAEVFIALEDVTLKSAASLAWLVSKRHWSMSTVESAINAVCRGMGFAWLPRHLIQTELQAGVLQPLKLKTGQVRKVSLFLIVASARVLGPSAQRLTEEILQQCATAG